MDGSVVDRGVVGVHSNDGSWADPGVVADHVGGVGHALADLVTLGGDDLLAVLDGRHVNMLSTHSPGHSPGYSNESERVVIMISYGSDMIMTVTMIVLIEMIIAVI